MPYRLVRPGAMSSTTAGSWALLSFSCRRACPKRLCEATDLGLAGGLLAAGMSGQVAPGQVGQGRLGQGLAGSVAIGVITGQQQRTQPARVSPRASFPPASRRRSCLRLGVSTTSSSRGLSPPSDRPCRAYSTRRRRRRRATWISTAQLSCRELPVAVVIGGHCPARGYRVSAVHPAGSIPTYGPVPAPCARRRSGHRGLSPGPRHLSGGPRTRLRSGRRHTGLG
jgi:hypothetical protein